MKLLHHKDIARWHLFSKKEQILNIASELSRIHHGEARGEAPDIVQKAYERCLELIDMTVADPKWQGETGKLLQLRDAIAALYTKKVAAEIPRLLYNLLLEKAENL